MEQRDYIQKQIDELGRVLGKIFSDLLGLKSQGQTNNGIETTSQALKNELDLELEDLIAMHTDKLIHTLKSEKNFTNENIDKLSEILLLIADSCEDGIDKDGRKIKLYEKCLTIYEYLEKAEVTYSFDRHLKIERIRKLI